MLDIGVSEFLLIAVVALIVIDPKDFPAVMRHVAKGLRELRAMYLGLKTQMHRLVDETGLNDLNHEVTTIIDLEGKPQQAYDVASLDQLKAAAPVVKSVEYPAPVPPHAD